MQMHILQENMSSKHRQKDVGDAADDGRTEKSDQNALDDFFFVCPENRCRCGGREEQVYGMENMEYSTALVGVESLNRVDYSEKAQGEENRKNGERQVFSQLS